MTKIVFLTEPTVELVSHNVSDQMVVDAARVSTGAGSNPARDKGLINALVRERHGSCFEHGSMTFLVEAPIFVVREWHRHRAGWSYNETSGRYRELEPRFYVPGDGRKISQVGKAMDYDLYRNDFVLELAVGHIEAASRAAYESYELLLDEGVAREVARMVLPLNLMTQFYATCNPRSLMHFLSLRTDRPDSAYPSKPQREIEMCAEQMEAIWAGLMPVTHEAFNTHGRVAP